jgi:ATP-dependent DNA ligase
VIYELLAVHTISPADEGNLLPYALMKYKDTDGEYEPFMLDDDWAAEQKMDGTRSMVSITSVDATWVAGGTTHAAAKMHHPVLSALLFDHLRFDKDGDEIVLDGELMIRTGEFYVFDVPRLILDGNVIVNDTTPHFKRREVLERLFDLWNAHHPQERIKLLPQARTEAEKRALLKAVDEEGGEGIVLKDLLAPYVIGRTRNVMKVKFVKTADVVVTGSTRSRNDAGRETGAFKFSVMENGQMIPMGSCSAIGKPDAQPGDVIEVAYLYRDETGGLVQPRMTRIREDKTPEECGMDQFPTYSRKAVSL